MAGLQSVDEGTLDLLPSLTLPNHTMPLRLRATCRAEFFADLHLNTNFWDARRHFKSILRGLSAPSWARNQAVTADRRQCDRFLHQQPSNFTSFDRLINSLLLSEAHSTEAPTSCLIRWGPIDGSQPCLVGMTTLLEAVNATTHIIAAPSNTPATHFTRCRLSPDSVQQTLRRETATLMRTNSRFVSDILGIIRRGGLEDIGTVPASSFEPPSAFCATESPLSNRVPPCHGTFSRDGSEDEPPQASIPLAFDETSHGPYQPADTSLGDAPDDEFDLEALIVADLYKEVE